MDSREVESIVRRVMRGTPGAVLLPNSVPITSLRPDDGGAWEKGEIIVAGPDGRLTTLAPPAGNGYGITSDTSQPGGVKWEQAAPSVKLGWADGSEGTVSIPNANWLAFNNLIIPDPTGVVDYEANGVINDPFNNVVRTSVSGVFLLEVNVWVSCAAAESGYFLVRDHAGRDIGWAYGNAIAATNYMCHLSAIVSGPGTFGVQNGSGGARSVMYSDNTTNGRERRTNMSLTLLGRR